MTRRSLFRMAAAALPVIAVRPEPRTSCPEMDWVPFGCWTRHEHTDACRSIR